MFRFIGLLILFFLSTLAAFAQEVELSIQPSTVEANQLATLKWVTKNATGVYIAGVGKVAAQGAQQVKAAQTTHYTIFAEGNSGVVTKTVRLEITGAKGGGDCPTPLDGFMFPISSSKQPKSFTNFLDQILHLLQDEMGFTVCSMPSQTGNFILVTSNKQRSDLVQPTEKGIRYRRISYFVEVEKDAKPNKGYGFTVKAHIDYQRMLEQGQWRPEEKEEICRPESERLRKKIDELPK